MFSLFILYLTHFIHNAGRLLCSGIPVASPFLSYLLVLDHIITVTVIHVRRIAFLFHLDAYMRLVDGLRVLAWLGFRIETRRENESMYLCLLAFVLPWLYSSCGETGFVFLFLLRFFFFWDEVSIFSTCFLTFITWHKCNI